MKLELKEGNMSTQILRPVGRGQKKHERPWLLKGTWGKRECPPSSRVALYERLHGELVESGVLPADSLSPSNRYHDHVTMHVMGCSWINGRWVLDL